MSLNVGQTTPLRDNFHDFFGTASRASRSDATGLVVDASAVTALLTTANTASSALLGGTGTEVMEDAGLQARVLIDCSGSCDPTSDSLAASKVAQPRVVTFDKTFRYLNTLDYYSTVQAMTLDSSAHGFNFSNRT